MKQKPVLLKMFSGYKVYSIFLLNRTKNKAKVSENVISLAGIWSQTKVLDKLKFETHAL